MATKPNFQEQSQHDKQRKNEQVPQSALNQHNQPGHAANKDQLNRLTERKDNHDKNKGSQQNDRG